MEVKHVLHLVWLLSGLMALQLHINRTIWKRGCIDQNPNNFLCVCVFFSNFVFYKLSDFSCFFFIIYTIIQLNHFTFT